MRINEAYEHEAILPGRPEEDCCKGCNKVTTQCVDVTAPLLLTPTACIGKVTVCCQGEPTVSCETNPGGSCCVVTLTQQVCVTVPVRYGVTMSANEPKIDCCGCECRK